jgi:hypothetical protein
LKSNAAQSRQPHHALGNLAESIRVGTLHVAL